MTARTLWLEQYRPPQLGRVLAMASGARIPLGGELPSRRMTVGGKDISKYTKLDVDRLREEGIEEMGQEWWDRYGEESLKAALVASGEVPSYAFKDTEAEGRD